MKLTNQHRTASVALGCLLLAVVPIIGCKSASKAPIAGNAATSLPNHETKPVETAIANSLAKWDGSSLKAYDQSAIEAIRSRWYERLCSYPHLTKGLIKVGYRLNAAGKISQVRVLENTTNDLELGELTKRAISDYGSFPAWSDEVRKEVGADYRDISFTFYYN